MVNGILRFHILGRHGRRERLPYPVVIRIVMRCIRRRPEPSPRATVPKSPTRPGADAPIPRSRRTSRRRIRGGVQVRGGSATLRAPAVGGRRSHESPLGGLGDDDTQRRRRPAGTAPRRRARLRTPVQATVHDRTRTRQPLRHEADPLQRRLPREGLDLQSTRHGPRPRRESGSEPSRGGRVPPWRGRADRAARTPSADQQKGEDGEGSAAPKRCALIVLLHNSQCRLTAARFNGGVASANRRRACRPG